MTYTDELLSAYLDGELDDAQMSEIEKALLEDKALDARLARLQKVNDAVKGAYQGLVEEPVSPEIVDLIQRKQVPESSVVEFHQRAENTSSTTGSTGVSNPDTAAPKVPAYFDRNTVWPTAIAASLALLVGYALSFVDSFDNAATGFQLAGAIEKDSALETILEHTPSAQRVNLNGQENLTVQPVLSFLSTDGEYCREILVNQQKNQFAIVACRAVEKWNVVLGVRYANSFDEDGEVFRTASDESQKVLDIFLGERMDGDAFGGEREKALIKNGWSALPDRAVE